MTCFSSNFASKQVGESVLYKQHDIAKYIQSKIIKYFVLNCKFFLHFMKIEKVKRKRYCYIFSLWFSYVYYELYSVFVFLFFEMYGSIDEPPSWAYIRCYYWLRVEYEFKVKWRHNTDVLCIYILMDLSYIGKYTSKEHMVKQEVFTEDIYQVLN